MILYSVVVCADSFQNYIEHFLSSATVDAPMAFDFNLDMERKVMVTSFDNFINHL